MRVPRSNLPVRPICPRGSSEILLRRALHGQFSATDEPVIFASPICFRANEQKHIRNQALVVPLLFDCRDVRVRVRTGARTSAGAEGLSDTKDTQGAEGAKATRRLCPR